MVFRWNPTKVRIQLRESFYVWIWLSFRRRNANKKWHRKLSLTTEKLTRDKNVNLPLQCLHDLTIALFQLLSFRILICTLQQTDHLWTLRSKSRLSKFKTKIFVRRSQKIIVNCLLHLYFLMLCYYGFSPIQKVLRIFTDCTYFMFNPDGSFC